MDITGKAKWPLLKGLNWQLYVANFAFTALTLIGSMLIAVQTRLYIGLGSTLGADYVAQPLLLYPLILLASALAQVPYALYDMLRDDIILSFLRQRFFATVLATLLAFMSIALFLPDVSLLQLLYFVLLAVALIAFTLFFTPNSGYHGERSLFDHLKTLSRHYALFQIWLNFNVRSRYSQTLLGILWIVLIPLTNALLYAFVFGVILRLPIANIPFVAFFLTGIVPWTLFQQSLGKGPTAIIAKMDLINQVYFPREILVFIKFGENLVDFTFNFGVLIIVLALNGIYPTWTYLFIIPVLFILSLLSIGLMLFVSYVSVFIRDLPQLIGVVTQALFYLTPIIYPLDVVPAVYRDFIQLNPLTPVVAAMRDIMLFHRVPDFISLYYPTVVSVLLLYAGYMFFKANEHNLADFP